MGIVLVPVDGSAVSARAIPVAVMVARATNASLALLRVEPHPDGRSDEGLVQRAASAYLARLADSIRREHGVTVRTSIRRGAVAQEVASEAEAASFVVIASHSHEGFNRALLGSVTEDLLDRSPVPVIVVPVRTHASDTVPPHRIVVPLDGSDLAGSIVSFMEDFAAACGAEVELLRVYRPVRLEDGRLAKIGQVVDGLPEAEIERRAREQAPPGRARDRQRFGIGEPSTEIVRAVDLDQAGLVALTTRGRDGLASARQSPVALAVLRHSKVPIMVFGQECLRRTVTSKRFATNI